MAKVTQLISGRAEIWLTLRSATGPPLFLPLDSTHPLCPFHELALCLWVAHGLCKRQTRLSPGEGQTDEGYKRSYY